MAALCVVITASASAQSPGAKWPPHTPDGQPDIQGFWASGAAVSSLDIEGAIPQLMPSMYKLQLKSLIIDPPDGKVPYKPGPKARRDAVRLNHLDPRPHELDPQTGCLLDGVPRINYQLDGLVQILQSKGAVILLYEFEHAYRVIPLDGRPHVAGNLKLWMGDSRGRWEGNTLVIDVTNLNDRTWLDVVGDHHGDQLHVVERWTFADPNTIRYEATLEDPGVYTRPWTMALTFKRQTEPDFQLLEQDCYEGERNSAHMTR